MQTEGPSPLAKQDMSQGPIAKKLIVFAVPLLLGDLFQQLYNLVDCIIVGQFVGKAAFAAIGSTTNIVNILVGFFHGMSIGATSIIARYFGARDQEQLSRAVYTTVVMTLAFGAVFTCIGVSLTPAFLRLMDTPDDVYTEAVLYLRIYFGGISGLIMYNMLSGILRAVGDSRRPLLFLFFCAAVNLALDLLFVIVFRWGIAGAAIATISAQFLSAGILLVLLSDPREVCQIKWSLRRVEFDILEQIVSVGLPTGLQRAVTALSNVIVLSYINAFGTDCMAGWSAYTKVDHIIVMPVQSMSMATTTFVGQNFGAKKGDRIQRGVRTAFAITASFTVTLIVIIVIFCRPIVSLFCTDESVIAFGTSFLRSVAPLTVITCINNVLAGALRGVGDSKAPMAFMLLSFVLLRQLYLLIGTRWIAGPQFVALSYPFGWAVCALMTMIYYRWRKIEDAIEPV